MDDAPKKPAVDQLGLEDIVKLTNQIGLEYVEAKKCAERLELMKPTIRAQIMLRLDNGATTEARLKRMTEADPDYVAFLEELSQAKSTCDRIKVRYDSYKNLFEARRSLLSYQKAEMRML